MFFLLETHDARQPHTVLSPILTKTEVLFVRTSFCSSRFTLINATVRDESGISTASLSLTVLLLLALESDNLARFVYMYNIVLHSNRSAAS